MSEETKQEKCLKLELAFDEAATAEVNRQKTLSKLNTTEELVSQALRVHGWFLDNRSRILIKDGEQVKRVTLEL